MPRGSKPGERRGGRKKGTPNKKTACIQAKLDKHGCDPIEEMAKLAMHAVKMDDMQIAVPLLKELAQYVAPKRKAVELSGDSENPLAISNIELVAPDIES